jgi:hypothetical protein
MIEQWTSPRCCSHRSNDPGEFRSCSEVDHQGRLGHLEDEISRVSPGPASFVLDEGQHARRLQGGGRKVAFDGPPLSSQLYAPADDPAVDLSDQPIFFRRRQELTRQDYLTVSRIPPRVSQ